LAFDGGEKSREIHGIHPLIDQGPIGIDPLDDLRCKTGIQQ